MDGDLEKIIEKALVFKTSSPEHEGYLEPSTLADYIAQAVRDAGYEKVPYIMEMKVLIHKGGIVQVESIKKGKKDLDTIEECTCLNILGNIITNYCSIHRTI